MSLKTKIFGEKIEGEELKKVILALPEGEWLYSHLTDLGGKCDFIKDTFFGLEGRIFSNPTSQGFKVKLDIYSKIFEPDKENTNLFSPKGKVKLCYNHTQKGIIPYNFIQNKKE